MCLTNPCEEESVVQQVVELAQALLHCLPARLWQVQIVTQWRPSLTREENTFCVCAVVQEWYAWTTNVAA